MCCSLQKKQQALSLYRSGQKGFPRSLARRVLAIKSKLQRGAGEGTGPPTYAHTTTTYSRARSKLKEEDKIAECLKKLDYTLL